MTGNISWLSAKTNPNKVLDTESLLKAAKWRKQDAEATVKQALYDPSLFSKLMPTSEKVEEIAKQLPEYNKELYFVHGQLLENSKKNDEAFTYYLKSAHLGFDRAKTNVGICYFQGKGVSVNKEMAFNYFLEAANANQPRAQYNLSVMYEYGDGIERNLDAAQYWCYWAAENGNQKAKDNYQNLVKKFNAGEEYFANGYRLEREGNYPEALRSYQAGAKAGSLPSKDKAAIFYLNGKGVTLNKSEANKLLLENAQAGYVRSMFNVALQFEIGDGIPKDLKQARSWYQEAAKRKLKQAQERLEFLRSSQLTELVSLTSTYLEREVVIWRLDPSLQPILEKKELYRLVPLNALELKKLNSLYELSPVPGMVIGDAKGIYHPLQESAFFAHVAMLEQRANNPSFKPDWKKEDKETVAGRKKWRKKFKDLTSTDPDFEHVQLWAGWHGTKKERFDSIMKSGYANLATTDEGFYGKGLYFTYNADYANRYSKKGVLILNWIATLSSYPVLFDDITKLKGQPNWANYDSHVAPVNAPKMANNEKGTNFFPIRNSDDEYEFLEIVTFQPAACLARYLVELVPAKTNELPVLARDDSKRSRDSKERNPSIAKK